MYIEGILLLSTLLVLFLLRHVEYFFFQTCSADTIELILGEEYVCV